MFRIAGQLPGAARLLSLARVLPRPVVDRAYDAYARRRYRLFGKADRCLVVGPEYRDRFLDGSGAPAG